MNSMPPEPAIAPEEVDRRLGANPVDLTALLAKADWSMRAGDRRTAGALYAAAAGSPDAGHGPASPDRQRAARESIAVQQAYIDHMLQTLSAQGHTNADWHPRFAKAIGIMTGQRSRDPAGSRWPQLPSVIYYPDLPDVDFVTLSGAEWADAIEDATEAVQAELDEILASRDGFTAYVSGKSGGLQNDYHGMLGNAEWSSHHLIENGAILGHAGSPTLAALESAPLCEIAGRTPSVLFSRLKPGAHIPPHTGMLNFRYICHLPIVVPGNGALRVGATTREWQRGSLMIFDDTVEHEAWNRSGKDRIVLIFDIWKPEIEEIEKHQIATLFSAVDSF